MEESPKMNIEDPRPTKKQLYFSVIVAFLVGAILASLLFMYLNSSSQEEINETNNSMMDDDVMNEDNTIMDDEEYEMMNDESEGTQAYFEARYFPDLKFSYDDNYWTVTDPIAEEEGRLGGNIEFSNSSGDKLVFKIAAFGGFGPGINSYCGNPELVSKSSTTEKNIAAYLVDYDEFYHFIMDYIDPISPEGLELQKQAAETPSLYSDDPAKTQEVKNPTICKGISRVYLNSNVISAEFSNGTPAGFDVITKVDPSSNQEFYNESYVLLDSMIQGLYDNLGQGENVQIFL